MIPPVDVALDKLGRTRSRPAWLYTFGLDAICFAQSIFLQEAGSRDRPHSRLEQQQQSPI